MSPPELFTLDLFHQQTEPFLSLPLLSQSTSHVNWSQDRFGPLCQVVGDRMGWTHLGQLETDRS